MTGKRKTIIFEERYGVSIDDFEDTAAVDRFVESKIGKPLKITDRRTPFSMRGGNVFKVSDRTRESIDESFSKSLKAVEKQRERLLREE